ncbi:MAG: BON domain-containing protein [Deltaproteobacteria bacterium]|nr:BON domain-containing protein [Deltaproteobacteria bacterium]
MKTNPSPHFPHVTGKTSSFPFRTQLILSLSLGLLLGLGACAARLGMDQETERSEAHQVADAELAAQVRGALLDKLGKDALGIQPQVSSTTATLWGQVQERSSQELAREIALSVPGIRRVKNRIALDKSGEDDRGLVGKTMEHSGAELRDAATENRVGLALLGELGRYGLDIEVESSDGIVSLRGPMPDQERKQRALKTAQDAEGVRKVIDLLELN